MSGGMQFHYTHVTAFIRRISLEWNSRGSAMTNHKKLIDVTVLLDWNCFLSQKKRFLK